MMGPRDDPRMFADDVPFSDDDDSCWINSHADGMVGKGRRHAVAIAVEMNETSRRYVFAVFHEPVKRAPQRHLVVDDVMFETAEVAEYRALLAHVNLRFVGLFAPLDVLEERERARGNRAIGLARGQFDRVHRGIAYDLEIDACEATPTKSAALICRTFGLEVAGPGSDDA